VNRRFGLLTLFAVAKARAKEGAEAAATGNIKDALVHYRAALMMANESLQRGAHELRESIRADIARLESLPCG
jgi:hypothetical protein